MELTKLLGLRMRLEDVFAILRPFKYAEIKTARWYVWSVIDDLKRWEGEQVEPEQVSTVVATLDKALSAISDEQVKAGASDLDGVVMELEVIRDALKKASVMSWGGTYTEYKD